jgi:hypothetical protein
VRRCRGLVARRSQLVLFQVIDGTITVVMTSHREIFAVHTADSRKGSSIALSAEQVSLCVDAAVKHVQRFAACIQTAVDQAEPQRADIRPAASVTTTAAAVAMAVPVDDMLAASAEAFLLEHDGGAKTALPPATTRVAILGPGA